MLESAGFSKANPYYVVQQGKVSFETHLVCLSQEQHSDSCIVLCANKNQVPEH